MESESPQDVVRARIGESISTKERLLADEMVGLIDKAASLVVNAYRAERKVLFFGNGGSAADAQHLAAELVGRFQLNRRALPALALASNTSVVTAIANDYDVADVFARQIEAFGDPGDVAVAISTSGRSQNVVNGVKAARARELATIGLTGGDGGSLTNLVDICIVVPATETARIQEGHILIGHIVCELIERDLFDATS
jgi:D-sedoheptulose 7-phosphate isomerase